MWFGLAWLWLVAVLTSPSDATPVCLNSPTPAARPRRPRTSIGFALAEELLERLLQTLIRGG